MAVDIVVQEVSGDPDEEHVNLVMASTDIPGAPEPGDTVQGHVVTVMPGLTFLVVSTQEGPGAEALTVEETAGDPDTEHRYVVTPKALLNDASIVPGTAMQGTTYQTSTGPVMLVQLPE